MVDGTLVPLFMQPAFFGNTWFDWKSNYSPYVQVSSIVHFISILLTVIYISLFQLQIYISLTMVSAYQEASMMPQHGQRHVFHKTIKDYLVIMNGYGLTLHIPCKNGASHLTRSTVYCQIMSIKWC
jgi:hypothetical protein